MCTATCRRLASIMAAAVRRARHVARWRAPATQRVGCARRCVATPSSAPRSSTSTTPRRRRRRRRWAAVDAARINPAGRGATVRHWRRARRRAVHQRRAAARRSPSSSRRCCRCCQPRRGRARPASPRTSGCSRRRTAHGKRRPQEVGDPRRPRSSHRCPRAPEYAHPPLERPQRAHASPTRRRTRGDEGPFEHGPLPSPSCGLAARSATMAAPPSPPRSRAAR